MYKKGTNVVLPDPTQQSQQKNNQIYYLSGIVRAPTAVVYFRSVAPVWASYGNTRRNPWKARPRVGLYLYVDPFPGGVTARILELSLLLLDIACKNDNLKACSHILSVQKKTVYISP